MAKNSNIEWCDHTFNPWIGCTKVSPGCKFCYAENQMDKRWKKVTWGPGNPRQRTSEANWKKPIAWNKEAEKLGIRYRVFCASLADVFDPEVPDEWRYDLMNLIEATPNLDWLLLTKRPEYAAGFLSAHTKRGLLHLAVDHPNIWIGTSVESQEQASQRIPWILEIPAKVQFLSCEPLLGSVDLSHFLGDNYSSLYGGFQSGVAWVIAGGESGPNARPCHPDWIRSLRDQCAEASVPFLFKQWGRWVPDEDSCWNQTHYPDWSEYRTIYPNGSTSKGGEGNGLNDGVDMFPAGKKKSGNHLDGKQHLEFPRLDEE